MEEEVEIEEQEERENTIENPKKEKSKEKTNKPRTWAILQQRLKAYHPIATPKSIIPLFLITGLIFVPIGAFIFFSNARVAAVGPFRYDEDFQSDSGNDCFGMTQNQTCSVTLIISEQMEAPIYVYYHMSNFYQNHRRYVKSKSDKQLAGQNLGFGDVASCTPLIGPSGDACVTTNDCDQDILIPCGLIANSYFSDSFKVYTPDLTREISIDSNGIAWWSDLQFKYGNPDGVDVLTNESWIGYKGHFGNNFPFQSGEKGYRDGRFINWMHLATLPTFKKLYGVIREDLSPGNYSLSIDYRFMTSFFGGTKSIELSTASWLGGRNVVLGYAYLAVGMSCLIISIGLISLSLLKPMKMGDPEDLCFQVPG